MNEPKYLCPDLDNIISELEDLRQAITKLRDWGRTKEEDLELVQEELDVKKSEITKLEEAQEFLLNKNTALLVEIENLQSKLSNTARHMS